MEPRIQFAIDEISKTYGARVSLSEKSKSLIKFGRNQDLSTAFETVWLIGGDEAYPSGNNIDIVKSDNAGDTQLIAIEGHTLSGTDLTFVRKEYTLTGTTPVSLDPPLYRANRLENLGSSDFIGTVTVEDNGTSLHLSTGAGNNQSLKCATSTSSVDYYIVTALTGGVQRQQTRSVDFRFQVREFGGVFKTKFPFSASTDSGTKPKYLGI